MKPIISDLVERFESGRLSRRELIGGLTMLMAASQVPAEQATPATPVPSLVGNGIDHVSVLVSDVARSTVFYQSLFGLSVLSEDKPHGIVRLGRKRVSVSIRKETPYGTVDHFGVSVENFNKDAVTQVLTQRGLSPQENWQYGFHVKDPDGVVVQML
jgi:catechol 2,3-dioxygenase-like lactoylglutathione lyase family enzyme